MMRPAIDDPFPGVRHVVVHPCPIYGGWWSAQLFEADGTVSAVLEGSYPNLGSARFDAVLTWDPVNRKIPVAVVGEYHLSNTETVRA